MARDFRPKDKSAKNKHKKSNPDSFHKQQQQQQQSFDSAPSSNSHSTSSKQNQHQSFNDDDQDDQVADDYHDDEHDDDEDLMANIKAMGGTKDDLKLISGLGKSKSTKGKDKKDQVMQFDHQDVSAVRLV